MKIEPEVIVDLKTERADIVPPLPTYLRIVPLGFYASVLGSIALAVVFVLQWRHASVELEAARQAGTQAQADLTAAQAERTALQNEAKRASDFVAWVEGSKNLQPLVVTIARSMRPESGITQLSLERKTESPNQINFNLTIQTAAVNQLDETLAAVRDRDYRPYSAKQSQERGTIRYEATLLWQPGGAARELPDTTPASTPVIPLQADVQGGEG